ncbi:MAG: carbohydrate porin [Fimbriimonadaceae bacterium]|nr:carbohydrate porin [Fimbriimonadaceae bacterium]
MNLTGWQERTAPRPFADRLLGDWGGQRTKLAQRGMSFDISYAAFTQGLFSGSGSKEFEFGNRFDFSTTLDTTKLGWWKGGYIRFHAEYFGGDLSSNLGGAVLPTNAGMKLPIDGKDQLTISNLALTQAFNPTTTVTLGRINTVDLLGGDPFFGGNGNTRFQHLAFVAPPNGLFPPVLYGAIYNQATAPLGYSLVVFDPNDQTQESFPRGLFRDGVSVSGSLKYSKLTAGRPTTYTLTAIYSSADSLDLRDALLPPGFATRSKEDSWHGSLQVGHVLRQYADRPQANVSLALKAGVSDGNPNPYQSFVTGGVIGRGTQRTRPNDSFGFGYFRYQFSRDLRQVAAPLLRIRSEEGFEAFYDYALGPGVGLTFDLQYVKPADGRRDNVFAGGLRLTFRF